MADTDHTTRIVVFGNPDFAPSRRMLAMIRDLAALRSDFDVEHVDVWQNPDRGIDHDVMTVPTMIIFVDDEEQKRIGGLRSARSLARVIDRIEPERALLHHSEMQTATAG
ncbi:MAG TPA: thioredoxin family protein [Acidimicrobiia bacterium]|jgi:predicted Rdx family selenoprotein|nr:thioredoxin family protein [Acidimicrobiia bacterium]